MEPYALGAVAIAIFLNVVFLRPFELTWAWAGLARHPDRTLSDFAQSPEFTPGLTYRVLRAGDGKVGMYQLLKAGGRLDSEFFPESIGRHSFPSTAVYSEFLRKRQVDTVIIFDNYDTRWRTNEHALLDQLAPDGTCSAHQVGVRPVEQRRAVRRLPRPAHVLTAAPSSRRSADERLGGPAAAATRFGR